MFLVLLFCRIGYPIPMFAGFCIMFISTISKCPRFVFCAWAPGRALRATTWRLRTQPGVQGVVVGDGIDTGCRKGWRQRVFVGAEAQRGCYGKTPGGRGGLLGGSWVPRLPACPDRGLARAPGSVRLLQQLRLPADRQVAAGHRVLLLLCSW